MYSSRYDLELFLFPGTEDYLATVASRFQELLEILEKQYKGECTLNVQKETKKKNYITLDSPWKFGQSWIDYKNFQRI